MPAITQSILLDSLSNLMHNRKVKNYILFNGYKEIKYRLKKKAYFDTIEQIIIEYLHNNGMQDYLQLEMLVINWGLLNE